MNQPVIILFYKFFSGFTEEVGIERIAEECPGSLRKDIPGEGLPHEGDGILIKNGTSNIINT